MKEKILLGVLTLSLVSMASAQQNIFTNIGVLQKAAVPILASVGWKDLGSGAGLYGSSLIELPTTAFVPSTVKYSISGSPDQPGFRIIRPIPRPGSQG